MQTSGCVKLLQDYLAGVDCGVGGVVGVDEHVLPVDGDAVQAQVQVAGGAPGALRIASKRRLIQVWLFWI